MVMYGLFKELRLILCSRNSLVLGEWVEVNSLPFNILLGLDEFTVMSHQFHGFIFLNTLAN